MLKFVWCWLFLLSLAMLWGFFLSCSEVGMAMATTSDRDPLRAEGPWRNQPVHREDGEAAGSYLQCLGLDKSLAGGL